MNDSLSPPVPPEDEPLAPAQAKPRPSARSETIETIRAMAFVVFVVLIVRTCLVQPFTIPSASMVPNLLVGDYILVTKFDYGFSRYSAPLGLNLFQGRIMGRAPARGDIVVFKFPANPRVDYVKRLIGLPGDWIQVINNVLYVNGKVVPDANLPRTAEDRLGGVTRQMETAPNGRRYMIQDMGDGALTDNTDIYIVPTGKYFVMGDNRDNSSDSRVDPAVGGVGFVPAENLEGRARIVLFSWEEGASLLKPWTWVEKVRLNRFFHLLH